MLDIINYDALTKNDKTILNRFITQPKDDLNYINNESPNIFLCHSPIKIRSRHHYSCAINASVLMKQLAEIKYKQQISTCNRLLDFVTKLLVIILIIPLTYHWSIQTPSEANKATPTCV